jgi:hypothetical protein
MDDEYKEMCLSWKSIGKKEEREEIREIIKTELLWKNQDEGFIGALHWMLKQLEEKDEQDKADNR